MTILTRLRELASLSSTIANEFGATSRIQIYTTIFTVIAQNRLPRSWRRPQKLLLTYKAKSFTLWVNDRTGLAAFKEIFIDREYELPDVRDPKVIIDAGANIGVASLYFLLEYPDSRVYAIEPDPDTCEILRKNVAAYPSASVHQYALSDVDGSIDFFANPESSIGSSMLARSPNARAIRVPALTMDSFLQKQGLASVDVLKFDIEGAEETMIRGISARDRILQYVGEIHADLMGISVDDFLRFFAGYYVTCQKISSQRMILRASRRNA